MITLKTEEIISYLQCENELSQETSVTFKYGGQGPVSLSFVHMQIGSGDSNKEQAGSFSSYSS